MSELSSLMVNTDELSCLKTEFSSVAKLIHELILRQSELASKLRLAGVETMESWSLDKEVPSSPWSTMPSSRNRRLSMPAFLDPWMRTTSVELVNRPIHFRDGMNVEKSCCHILRARILHHQDQLGNKSKARGTLLVLRPNEAHIPQTSALPTSNVSCPRSSKTCLTDHCCG
ncbi:hypothetical protein AAFF_G00239620 [Aldrovandia affinis]|uniref:Uncharacterized protein n=1 Tax=Aldrovandia affinis TaxID=143900 RepID=A0AAD7REH3_9TELE|nr:hypothetical protein AAFF_G00239620 [Aldrovandia affinis]